MRRTCHDREDENLIWMLFLFVWRSDLSQTFVFFEFSNVNARICLPLRVPLDPTCS